MSPFRPPAVVLALVKRREVVPKPENPDGLVLEAWAQGYLVGSLIIMAFITMANMRKGVLLHKLILLELILGLWQGFWLFFDTPVYAWWLSVGAIFLNASWSLHNVISWMKIRPFLSRPVSWVFIGTVILVQPYWVVEIYANFAYFHGINKLFLRTRPWEALCRDPWWIFTTVALFWTIKTQYELTLREIIKISPRFGIMLLSMILSIIFIILDICAVTGAFDSEGLPVGINPFWKLAFVFKCLTDSVVLDDFKTALDRLRAFKISRIGSFSQDTSDRRTWNDGNLVQTWEGAEADARRRPVEASPSPDGALVHSNHFPGFTLHRKNRRRKDEANVHREMATPPAPIHRDFVTSALEDPSVSPKENGSHQYFANDATTNPGLRDKAGSPEEDYAQAVRDVEGQRSSTEPPKNRGP